MVPPAMSAPVSGHAPRLSKLEEVEVAKKERRLVKNREAAKECRRKKKECVMWQGREGGRREEQSRDGLEIFFCRIKRKEDPTPVPSLSLSLIIIISLSHTHTLSPSLPLPSPSFTHSLTLLCPFRYIKSLEDRLRAVEQHNTVLVAELSKLRARLGLPDAAARLDGAGAGEVTDERMMAAAGALLAGVSASNAANALASAAAAAAAASEMNAEGAVGGMGGVGEGVAHNAVAAK